MKKLVISFSILCVLLCITYILLLAQAHPDKAPNQDVLIALPDIYEK